MGDADASRYAAALDVLLGDPDNDAVLVLNVQTAIASAAEIATMVTERVKAYREKHRSWAKPVLASWIGADQNIIETLSGAGIPNYPTEDDAVRGFMYLVRHREVVEELSQVPPAMPVAWQQLYARRSEGMRASDIREILKVTAQPDVISLAGGLPAPELFPIDEYRRAFEWVLETDGAQALQYGPSEGYRPLRMLLAERLARAGILCECDDLLITNGSQQALDLIGKILLDPGDTVRAHPIDLATVRIEGVMGRKSDERDAVVRPGGARVHEARPRIGAG